MKRRLRREKESDITEASGAEWWVYEKEQVQQGSLKQKPKCSVEFGNWGLTGHFSGWNQLYYNGGSKSKIAANREMGSGEKTRKADHSLEIFNKGKKMVGGLGDSWRIWTWTRGCFSTCPFDGRYLNRCDGDIWEWEGRKFKNSGQMAPTFWLLDGEGRIICLMGRR